MKLNVDCIRGILLTVESSTDPEGTMYFAFENTCEIFDDSPEESTLTRNSAPYLSTFSDDEIIYHLRQCEMSDLIGEIEWMHNSCIVQDLTPYGHEFLSSIRDDNNLKEIKGIAAKIGTTSLQAISAIGTNLINAMINAQF